MKPVPEDHPSTDAPKLSDRMLDDAGQTYRRWNEKLSLQEEDPLWLIAGKLLLRLATIVLLLILSPFILFGLVFAFAAVF